MERRKGFLLIEFIFSLALLSFSIVLYAQFFSRVVGWYHQARERLYALQLAQNSTERLWQGKQVVTTIDNYITEIKQLPLPTIATFDLPHTDLDCSYQMIQVSKKVGAQQISIALPGYVHAAKQS